MIGKRRIIQAVAGMALGVALCFYLVQTTGLTAADWQGLLDNVNPLALCGVAGCSYLIVWAGARKWAYLDHHFDGRVAQPEPYYFRHYVWQIWLAQILPSTLAMIAGRALVTQQGGEQNWKRGFRSAMVDQLAELFVILAFVPISLWRAAHDFAFCYWLLGGLATMVAGFALGRAIRPRYFLAGNLAWSFLRIALVTLRCVLGAVAFGFALPNDHISYALPLATLTVLIPLTPGNLGLAEWGWTYALLLWGNDKTLSALYTLSFRVLILVMQTLMLPLAFLRARQRG